MKLIQKTDRHPAVQTRRYSGPVFLEFAVNAQQTFCAPTMRK